MNVMTVIRDVANAGHAVISTIHQPAAEIFEMFDSLLLLQKGGRTAYFGPLGDMSETLIDYFVSNGAAPPKERENPADYMLREIAHQQADKEWGTVWIQTAECNQVIASLASSDLIPSHIKPMEYNSKDYPGFVDQVRAVQFHRDCFDLIFSSS